jgi:hypothetical protein
LVERRKASMTIYYQHIGRALWARDAPRSIGTERGLKEFSLADIMPHLADLTSLEVEKMKGKLTRESEGTFQIWGLPTGAQHVIRELSDGDHLLLLESEDFRYVGKVVHHLSEPCWDLSQQIWGEQKFPLIVLLQGSLVRYSWEAFVSDFGFAQNYHMRGNTMKLADAKLRMSPFGSEDAFVEHLVRTERP